MLKVELGGEFVAELTLFELWSGGHTPNYIRWLVEAWQSQGPGTLRAIITNRFLKQHEYVFRDLLNVPGSVIRWTAIDDADEVAIEAARTRAQAVDSASGKASETAGDDTLLSLYWTLLQKYGRKFPSRHILLMNLDEYLLPLSAGRAAPADLSGIFFRPNYIYRSKAVSDEFRIFDVVQEQLVRRSLNHPQLRLVFSYVPEVAEGLHGRETAKVIHLHNPVQLPTRHASLVEKATIRSRLGVPADRELFLFFGEIRGPKGLWKLLDSLRFLRADQEARICLAIVGQAEAVVEQRLASELKEIGASTQLMILRRAAYVDDTELFEWFTAADVVIAPYVRHAGTSGILLLAAAYRKPLISQDYGAMAKVVRENSLGLTVDTNDPTQLARAIGRCLGETPPHEWNAEKAYGFALNHSHEKFGQTLIGALQPFLV
jgi:glycosyltransferase involved in cell wall biosynthesis